MGGGFEELAASTWTVCKVVGNWPNKTISKQHKQWLKTKKGQTNENESRYKVSTWASICQVIRRTCTALVMTENSSK